MPLLETIMPQAVFPEEKDAAGSQEERIKELEREVLYLRRCLLAFEDKVRQLQEWPDGTKPDDDLRSLLAAWRGRCLKAEISNRTYLDEIRSLRQELNAIRFQETEEQS